MSQTLQELGIDRLSASERVALALEIWDSLETDWPAGDLSAAQRADLARRDTELEAKPGMALTWEQLRASVEGQDM